MQRKRFSADQWRAWFLEFEAGELTVQQFCDVKGTTANTFYNWRRRLRAMQDDAVPSSNGAGEVANDSTFVTVGLTTSEVEFQWPTGVVARVPNDSVSLRPLVEVLLELGAVNSEAQS